MTQDGKVENKNISKQKEKSETRKHKSASEIKSVFRSQNVRT